MRRLWAGILLVAVLFSGCSRQSQRPTLPRPTLPTESAGGQYYADYASGRVRAGSVQLGYAENQSGSVVWEQSYPGKTGADYTDPAEYTFREHLSASAGLKWAPHTWETANDRYVLQYITAGFYDMVLDAQGKGVSFVSEMASAPPEDVTQAYVGSFGIGKGDTARAWKIALNPRACWENGVPINADTYLYSYQQLLDGRMMNRRADSLYAGEFSIVGAKDYLYGKCGWEDVGILKTGEQELVLITTAPIADPAFYVPYYLMSTFLVYEPLWEACKTCFDAAGKQVPADSPDVATVSTSYATSLETTISYGPYKLTYFELDKQITLERNENWYGYADGKHLGQYQTDRISCQIIDSHATALLAFLGGDLDTIRLQAADMSRYATSDAVRYQPESYTTKLSFNTDPEALSARGTGILADVHFRRALALAIDRTRFAASFTSAGVPGYGLLNDMYIYDPYTGGAYRRSTGAQNALVQLYGMDKETFGGLEQAYAAITGYDPELARALMQQSFDAAVAAGLYDGVSPIPLQLCVYQSEDLYVQMYHFLRDALEMACRGTDLEGKITLEMVVDADYYATMESGLTDMIFSTWGGSAYDPYGVLYQCYCDAGVAPTPNQMEYGFDASAVTVEMTLNGKQYAYTLQDWARWCSGENGVDMGDLAAFRAYDAETRCNIYANLEYAYLTQTVTTPLYYRNSAVLVSHKGDYPLRQYLDPVGFGGLRYYTYHYDDISWEKVKSGMQY